MMENKPTILPAEGTVVLAGKPYSVTACIRTPDGRTIPVVDIPVMSDEKWHELTRRARV